MDLKYANIHLSLEPEMSNHCNFNINSGIWTFTYGYLTGFTGPSNIPAAFQQEMVYALVGLETTICLLEDIKIVSRGPKEEQLKLVNNCLKNG